MEKKLILFLSANPKDTNYAELELIKECNDVADKIKSARHANEVDFRQRHEISIGNIQEIIADNNPQIVHFTGHGEKEHLVLEGIDGQTELAKAQALASMFGILNKRSSLTEEKKIRCVVLSACYSKRTAKAVARHVDFVVGMSNAIRQDTASIFAEHFYYHLCSGESFGDAFEIAKQQIKNLGIPGQNIPELEKRNDINPSAVFLFTAEHGWTKRIRELDQKYKEFAVGNNVTVKEFWENESRGGLCNILLDLSDNHEDAGITQGEKDKIDIVLANVPPRLVAWDEAVLSGNPVLRDQLDGQIRRMYSSALGILRKCLGSSRSDE